MEKNVESDRATHFRLRHRPKPRSKTECLQDKSYQAEILETKVNNN